MTSKKPTSRQKEATTTLARNPKDVHARIAKNLHYLGLKRLGRRPPTT